MAVLSALLLWPLLNVVSVGFETSQGEFTTAYLQLVLSDPVLSTGLLRSAGIAVATTLLALLIALPLAVISSRFQFRGRAALTALSLLPLVLPPFVGAMGTRLLLSRFGPLTQLFGQTEGLGTDWLGRMRIAGVVVVEALSLYPIILLNLQAALANVDPQLERAARNLGASRWSVFVRITLPLVRPGVFAGCTLVSIWSFTELGTPLMFHVYDVTPVQVFTQITEPDNPIPYALVVVMLLASVLLYALGKMLLGRRFEAVVAKTASRSQLQVVGGLRGLLLAAPFCMVIALAALPNLSVVLTSLSQTGAWHRSVLPRAFTLAHFGQALEDDLIVPQLQANPPQFGAVLNSISYAGVATAVGVALALAVVLIVVRSRVPFRWLLDWLAMLPLAVPGLVLAFGYLSISVQARRAFGEATPAWLDVQRFPVVLLIVAYAARRLPFVVRSVAAGLEQVPRSYERAAANLGARPRVVLFAIVLPLIVGSVLAGALMAFVFSMLEVSDSLILAQSSRFFPITRAIWELSQRLGDGLYVASALGVWAMALLITTLLLASALLGKALGSMFRL